MLSAIFFWVFAIGAVGCSLAVLISRNPLYSALWLILDFFFFAGLYGLLSAHFMAILQVLVYGGAIMVLFMFIIMLLNLPDEQRSSMQWSTSHVLAALGGVGMLTFLVLALTPWMGANEALEANRVQVAEAHAAAIAAAETDEAKEELAARGPALAYSEPAFPGLYLDLNEEGLEQKYQEKLVSAAAGGDDLIEGKYRRFDPSIPFVLPPSLDPTKGDATADAPVGFGTVEPISMLVVNRYVVPFELTALLLLAAIVGAVIIAKRRV